MKTSRERGPLILGAGTVLGEAARQFQNLAADGLVLDLADSLGERHAVGTVDEIIDNRHLIIFAEFTGFDFLFDLSEAWGGNWKTVVGCCHPMNWLTRCRLRFTITL